MKWFSLVVYLKEIGRKMCFDSGNIAKRERRSAEDLVFCLFVGDLGELI